MTYYTIIGDPSIGGAPATPDRYFRVTDRGVYSRWDPREKTWTEVTDPRVRDFYSRGIEAGDGIILSTPAEVAKIT